MKSGLTRGFGRSCRSWSNGACATNWRGHAERSDGGDMGAVRYLYLCPDHGELASTLIDAQTSPPDRCCPTCLASAEVWVGTALQASSIGVRPVRSTTIARDERTNSRRK